MQDRIIELAGAGVPQAVIAATVGCDASYVSQLLSSEEVASRVSELRLEKAQKMVEHDNKIHGLEQAALQKMENLLPMQTDLMKVTRVFQTLNSARKSSDVGVAANGQVPGTVVTLNLPAAAMVEFKLTADRQVIEIAGRSMTPLPSHMVAKRLRELQANRVLESALLENSAASTKTKSIVESL